MEPLIAPIASGVISAVLATVACYVAITNRVTKLETLMESVRDETRRHNEVVERTYALERDVKTTFMRIDELREDVKDLQKGRQ